MFSRRWCGLQVFSPLAAVPFTLGTGYKHLGVSLIQENVPEQVNSRSFNLHSDYSKSLTLSNVGEPS